MPIDPCIPCACDPAALMLDPQSAAVTVGRILCDLLTGVQDIAIATGATQPSTAAVTSVPDLDTNQTLLAANINRRGAILFNDSDQVAYVKLGATATLTDYSFQLQPGAYFNLPGPVYTGQIDAIWAADSTGAMKVTEILP